MTRLRQRMLEDLQRRKYSPGTILGYIRAVQLAEYFETGAVQINDWRFLQMEWVAKETRDTFIR
jgi:hypothetical protein